jgi:hypothetical protein
MGIVETLRDVLRLVQKADNIQLNQKILELQSQLMDLLSEKQRCEGQIADLHQKLSFQGTLEFRDNMYWRSDPNQEDGPFCSRCWDVNRNAVRLQLTGDGAMWCPECKAAAQKTPSTRPRTPWHGR